MIPAPAAPAAPAAPIVNGAPAARAIFARGVTVGFALGVVLGAALALGLTRSVEDIVRVVRGHLVGEAREPRFELLN